MAALYIPKKLKVGFCNRPDTFTGKLAYVIYYDDKNKLRKEKSWTGWCDKTIESIEIDNVPRSGFVFNKGIKRDGYYWGSGRSVIRVYDPRDFEFEINVDNLIGILMHSDVSKRDIVEECVFAWNGADLVLLPVNSEDYQQSVIFTNKQANKVSAKSLVKGVQYHKKSSDDIVTYLGYFEWWEDRGYSNYTHTSKGKKHIFHAPTKYGKQFSPLSMSTLSHPVSDEIVDDYANLVETFFTTSNSQGIVGYKVVPGEIDYNPVQDYVRDENNHYPIYDEHGVRMVDHPTKIRYNAMYRIIGNNKVESLQLGEYDLNHPYFNVCAGYGQYGQYSYEYDIAVDSFRITQTRAITLRNQFYYSSTNADLIIPGSILDQIRTKAKERGYTDNLPIEVHNKILTELGFGTFYTISSSGTEIKHNIR